MLERLNDRKRNDRRRIGVQIAPDDDCERTVCGRLQIGDAVKDIGRRSRGRQGAYAGKLHGARHCHALEIRASRRIDKGDFAAPYYVGVRDGNEPRRAVAVEHRLGDVIGIGEQDTSGQRDQRIGRDRRRSDRQLINAGAVDASGDGNRRAERRDIDAIPVAQHADMAVAALQEDLVKVDDLNRPVSYQPNIAKGAGLGDAAGQQYRVDGTGQGAEDAHAGRPDVAGDQDGNLMNVA